MCRASEAGLLRPVARYDHVFRMAIPNYQIEDGETVTYDPCPPGGI